MDQTGILECPPVVSVAFESSAVLSGAPNQFHRILVVEDDGDIRRLNTTLLICAGYRVDAVEDGAAAWDSLQINRYDLIITDNEMPKMTGVELLVKLHETGMVLTVIMATGSLPKPVFTRSPWLRPAATLCKPYSTEELLQTVRKVLQSRPTHGS
jgi:two-component system chemotaxis response regulator CheY